MSRKGDVADAGQNKRLNSSLDSFATLLARELGERWDACAKAVVPKLSTNSALERRTALAHYFEHLAEAVAETVHSHFPTLLDLACAFPRSLLIDERRVGPTSWTAFQICDITRRFLGLFEESEDANDWRGEIPNRRSLEGDLRAVMYVAGSLVTDADNYLLLPCWANPHSYTAWSLEPIFAPSTAHNQLSFADYMDQGMARGECITREETLAFIAAREQDMRKKLDDQIVKERLKAAIHVAVRSNTKIPQRQRQAKSFAVSKSATANANAVAETFIASQDYYSIRVGKECYALTKLAGEIVCLLRQASHEEKPYITGREIKRKTGCGKVWDAFRRRDGRRFWARFIFKPNRDAYALQLQKPETKNRR
jgi:hypothetical protein